MTRPNPHYSEQEVAYLQELMANDKLSRKLVAERFCKRFRKREPKAVYQRVGRMMAEQSAPAPPMPMRDADLRTARAMIANELVPKVDLAEAVVELANACKALTEAARTVAKLIEQKPAAPTRLRRAAHEARA